MEIRFQEQAKKQPQDMIGERGRAQIDSLRRDGHLLVFGQDFMPINTDWHLDLGVILFVNLTEPQANHWVHSDRRRHHYRQTKYCPGQKLVPN